MDFAPHNPDKFLQEFRRIRTGIYNTPDDTIQTNRPHLSLSMKNYRKRALEAALLPILHLTRYTRPSRPLRNVTTFRHYSNAFFQFPRSRRKKKYTRLGQVSTKFPVLELETNI
ncbi:uncharacterized protein N7518_002766 [Penicillium psychrosexuale]|uniref:uncharacterized protein n=1 Tax=Penicillium psychrosexuale TaxID=1002107 RepID=UPI0025452B77|nr:uncharacterized protein N7518_002766 [Penicillium psychrosexuale]KAJ5800698.1 hypothetical protein N7518_002766 [Penicillium psychrosexuale]